MKTLFHRGLPFAVGLGAVTFLVNVWADPGWWTSGSEPVIDSSAPPNKFGPANLGQLKHITEKAMEECGFSGTGPEASSYEARILTAEVASWDLATSDNYAPVNTGQLKAMAEPFHGFLMLDRPWGGAYGTADNFALANIGQLKNAFKFEADATATGDLDGDGLTNAEEALRGTNPRGADSDRDGVDDDVDAFPNDPSASSLGPHSGSDTTGPVITLLQPAHT